jgi:hypothetical protein
MMDDRKAEIDQAAAGDKARQQVLKHIKSSKQFDGAPARVDLLKYLYKNRDRYVSEAEIAIDHLGLQDDRWLDTARVRKLCQGLRKNLSAYAESDCSNDEWKFVLNRSEGLGYRLVIKNLHALRGATHRFWYAHLNPARPVMIVHDEPLFFRDEINGTVIRVPQYEVSGEEKSLDRASSEIARMFKEEVTESLRPCHLYTLSGSIGARDKIADWFSDEYGVKTKSQISRRMLNISALSDCSPILLGNIRTNKLVKGA